MKHTEQFKLAVVERYLQGTDGYERLARECGVEKTMLRRWVLWYRTHGVAGLTRKSGCYSVDFKLSVLQHMWDNALSHTQVAAVFNVRNISSIAAWERRYQDGGVQALDRPRGLPSTVMRAPTSKPDPSVDDDKRSREDLLKELEYLRMENAYLKKVEAGSSKEELERAEKAQVVLELRQQFPLSGLLEIAGLSKSTFHYQVKAQQGGDKYDDLKKCIKAVFEQHKARYGYRRVTAALRQAGHVVNHKTVQRLMGELGLKSLVKVKKYQSYKGETGQAAPNVLDRQFTAEKANEKWVTDVTEFKVAGEKLYLSTVMDLFNGEIVAFETARRPMFELVTSMLTLAMAKLRKCDRPLLHSDQGWHYRMPAYQQMLSKRKLTQSMSRKGNCHDNAAMESFFGTLKSEFFYLNKFASIEQLQKGLGEYIHYYNHERIKLSLGGLSPVQFRIQASKA
nr:IS3 family transposase [Massilia sp. ZL223]